MYYKKSELKKAFSKNLGDLSGTSIEKSVDFLGILQLKSTFYLKSEPKRA